jgi:hypothetical protein
MHLFGNPSPRFTGWVARSRALEKPFVLVDIGVQGGIHPRWEALGDQLQVYGFDALEAISRLDTLVARGVVPPPDFTKLDCEGAEPEILAGARATLALGGILGAEIESNFNVSPILPQTHFWACYRALLPARLLLLDLAFERTPFQTFAETAARLHRPSARLASISPPSTFNVLLCRDFVLERRSPDSFPGPLGPAPAADQLIKLAIILELYGMLDAAYDVLAAFPDALNDRFSTEYAASLLVPNWRQLGESFLARLWRRAKYELTSRRFTAGSG